LPPCKTNFREFRFGNLLGGGNQHQGQFVAIIDLLLLQRQKWITMDRRMIEYCAKNGFLMQKQKHFGKRCLVAVVVLAVCAFDSVASDASNQNQVPQTQDQQNVGKDESLEIQLLIRRLGSQSFRQRQIAMEELFQYGPAAKPALLLAAKDANVEIARRSEYLLSLLRIGITAKTAKPLASKILKFYGGSYAQRQTILTQLIGEGEYLKALDLLALTDPQFQEDFLDRQGSKLTKFEYQRLRSANYELIDQIMFHPLMWKNLPERSIHYATIRGKLQEQFDALSRRLEQAEKVDEDLIFVTARLALLTGGLEKAEPFLKRLKQRRRLELILDSLAKKGLWSKILKLERKYSPVDENRQKMVRLEQRILLSRWSGERANYDQLLEAVIGKTDKELPGSVSLTVNNLIANLEIEKAEKYFASDSQDSIFRLLCYLNRYEQAFDNLKMGSTRGEQRKWFQKKTKELAAINEKLRKQYDREIYRKANELFTLLSHVAYYRGSLGQINQAGEFFDLLADSDATGDYRAVSRRTEMLRLIVRLEDRDYCWKFIENRYPEPEIRAALSTFFETESGLAEYWFELLTEEYKNPFDRLKAVSAVLQHPATPKNFEVDLDRLIGLAISKNLSFELRLRGSRTNYLADTMLLNDREQEAIDYWKESIDSGNSSAISRLANYYFDREKWALALETFEMSWGISKQPVDLYFLAICHKHLGREKDYQRIRSNAEILINSSDDSDLLISRLQSRREHEEAIRFIERYAVGRSRMRFPAVFWLQNLVTSLEETDPAKAAKYRMLSLLSYMDSAQPGTNRLAYANFGRQAEFGRIHQAFADGKIEKAFEIAQRCHQFNPGDSSLAEDYVPLFEQANRKDLADKLFEAIAKFHQDILKTYPDSALHHNNYAWICASCGRRAKDSLVHARKACSLRPRNSNYLDTLAEAYFQNGNRDEAIKLAEQCIRLNPSKVHYRRQLTKFRQLPLPKQK
jgi:hypothetical protein